ncbi:MAG: phosphatase PAP2 family protein [Anaerolineales bacterium]|nr:phosphatase PAP2 family protein [Anaerolineales bacterium]
MDAMLEWGIPIIEWLQSLGAWLEPVMQFFTFLGTENFYLLILPVFLWWIDVRLGIRIGLALLVSAVFNGILKVLFGLPRPYWVSDDIQAFSSETSFGLPSGHAQNAIVIWGLLAAWSKNRWFRAGMVLLIAMISLSRTFLGVHFPSDTIAGLLVGGVILWVLLRLEEPVRKRFESIVMGKQILLVSILALLLLGLGLGSLYLTRGRPIPEEWVAQAAAAMPRSDAIDPVSPDGIISNVATIFGISVGAILLVDWGGFDPRGTWAQRLGRYFLGLIGLILLFFGLRLILPTDPPLLGAFFRFLRYALVGLWVAYLAPRFFCKIRLA